MAELTGDQMDFLAHERVARLATADAAGRPHVIPVCYAFDGKSFFIALDEKPKRVEASQLKRIRNILVNPHIALVIDRYSDDWSKLAYILVPGVATLIAPGSAGHSRAIGLLRERYPQYRTMAIEEQPVIAIRPSSVTAWGAIDRGSTTKA